MRYPKSTCSIKVNNKDEVVKYKWLYAVELLVLFWTSWTRYQKGQKRRPLLREPRGHLFIGQSTFYHNYWNKKTNLFVFVIFLVIQHGVYMLNQWSVWRKGALQFQAVPFQATNWLTRSNSHKNIQKLLAKEPIGGVYTRLSSLLKSFSPITNLLTMCDKIQTSKDGSVDLCHCKFAEFSSPRSIQQYSSNSSRKQRNYHGKG